MTTMTEDLLKRARAQIAHAQAHSAHYARTLEGLDPASVAGLAAMPVLRKSDLIAAQEADPPFGGIATTATGAMARLFLSPGPIAEPQGSDTDIWRLGRALSAAGFGAGDVVSNCFSYHLTPAGLMFDMAARGLGAAVFPGGTGNREAQAQAMRRFGVTGYIGTPDFLRAILEKADEDGAPVTTLRRALVTGGPLFPDLRAWYEARGISVRQCYATADLGLIAYEDGGEGMALDPDCIVEIVRPGTGDPVPQGEVGEVVVTTFDPAYPLIRFATGDLSAIMPGDRIRGWMGRADQTTKVRGMFVHPEQVARVLAAHGLARGRLVVEAEDGQDRMTLLAEGAGDADAVAETARVELRLRAEVRFVGAGALPNDGKVIEDKRSV